MKVEFGTVKKYLTDRGFGFIEPTSLSKDKKEIFFHIKKIKKSNPDFAKKLDDETCKDTYYFWYETEKTEKGEQVSSFVKPSELREKISNDLPFFVEKIESIWLDTNVNLPAWIEQATIDLLGENSSIDLASRRNFLEVEIAKEKDKLKKEAEEKRKIEEENQKTLMAEMINQRILEESEFRLLVEEVRSLGFTHSKQVSSYIIRNQLGNKYKHISGVVKMEMNGDIWDFKGGFPPEIYSKLCGELGLSNQGTHARVVSFKSFKSISS